MFGFWKGKDLTCVKTYKHKLGEMDWLGEIDGTSNLYRSNVTSRNQYARVSDETAWITVRKDNVLLGHALNGAIFLALRTQTGGSDDAGDAHTSGGKR